MVVGTQQQPLQQHPALPLLGQLMVNQVNNITVSTLVGMCVDKTIPSASGKCTSTGDYGGLFS